MKEKSSKEIVKMALPESKVEIIIKVSKVKTPFFEPKPTKPILKLEEERKKEVQKRCFFS